MNEAAIDLSMLPDPLTHPATDTPSPSLSQHELIHQAKLKLKERYGSQRWRLDHLYYIVNEKGQEILFQMNLVQKILYYGLWFFNVVLKSRQHGVTTFIALLYLDICLFNSNIHAVLIAHSREEAEEIFERVIKHAYNRLDPGLLSVLSAPTDSRRKLAFSNGSSVRVTTSGRSGTYQLVHVSEYGKVSAKYPEKAREIKTGTLNAIHPGQLITIESSAEGREGEFYDICRLAQKVTQKTRSNGYKLSVMEPKFHFFPWYLNPLNVVSPVGVPILKHQQEYFEKIEGELQVKLRAEQKAWYVLKWNVQGDDMKREHPSTPEEAFYAAVVGTYYHTQFTKIRQEGRIAKVPHLAGTSVDTWWDIGIGDATAIWFTQDVGREIHVIDYYENSGEGLEHYRDVLDEKTRTRGFQYGTHGAPHDIKHREWLTPKARIKAAAELGIKFVAAPRLAIESGIEAVRRILSICVFDEVHCEKGIKALEHYRKEWNPDLQAYRKVPLHDWASNGSDAFRTMSTLHRFATYAQNLAAASQRDGYKQPAHELGEVTPNQARRDPESWT